MYVFLIGLNDIPQLFFLKTNSSIVSGKSVLPK